MEAQTAPDPSLSMSSTVQLIRFCQLQNDDALSALVIYSPLRATESTGLLLHHALDNAPG